MTADIPTTIRVAYLRRELADALGEIERLRALITAWADADDRKVTNVVIVELGPKASGPEDVAIALRKAVGR